MMDSVPFCQRNTKLWVSSLIASGILVLAFAIWLALDESRLGRPTGVAGGPAPAPVSVRGAAQQVALVTIAQTGQRLVQPQQTSFAQAADIIRPAVVNINAVRQGPPPLPPLAANAPRFIDPFDGVPEKVFGNVAYESVGSGVIIDPAGYVVTNNHLVAGATSIVVTRFNHPEQHLSARLAAVDARSDLALLKLQGTGPYPAASLADSSRVEVGQPVIAVGNPFGLGHTVTSGIISGRQRSLAIGGVQYTNLLQTDAPINQGSSGGPLVDLRGKVVGINTAIYAPTGVFSGTGFAIPASRVGAFVARATQGQLRPVAQLQVQAPAQGQVGGAVLGCTLIDTTPELAQKLGLAGRGAFVTSVAPGSPAAEAELSRGDVVLALAGVPVADSAGLRALASRLPPGQDVAVTVWRGGKARRLDLNLR